MFSLELVAVVLTLLAVILTVRQIIWCWPLAMISVALYAVVFYEARLYADMGLQGLYLGLAAYGWWAWLHGGEGDGELEVSLTPGPTRLRLLLAATLGGILLGQALTHFTNASPSARKRSAAHVSSKSSVSNPTKTHSTTWRLAVPTGRKSCSTLPRRKARIA